MTISSQNMPKTLRVHIVTLSNISIAEDKINYGFVINPEIDIRQKIFYIRSEIFPYFKIYLLHVFFLLTEITV